MRTKFPNQFLLVFITSLFIFTSCFEKDRNEKPLEFPEGDGPSLLDFSTSRKVNLNMEYSIPTGVATTFDLYAENPLKSTNSNIELKAGLTPIAGGIIVSGQYHATKTIPSSVKELYALSKDLFAPTLMYAPITGDQANFEEIEFEAADSGEEQVTTKAVDKNGKIDYYLTSSGVQPFVNTLQGYPPVLDINSMAKPNYISKTKEIPQQYLNNIISAFPNTKKADPQYYSDAIVHLEYKPAEVWISVIHSDGDYNSALSYFYYDGKTPGDRTKIKEVLAFPKAKVVTGGLQRGEYVQLKYYDEKNKTWVDEFPKGTSIGFILRANGFRPSYSKKAPRPYIDQNIGWYPKYYSYNQWNPEPNKKQHTIYFNAASSDKEAPFICFGFEDKKNEGYDEVGDGDCNDVMFNVDISPIDAIIKPPFIPEAGDAVKSETKRGIVAFEDQWPKKADYDLNDVVVGYESTVTYLWATLKETEDSDPSKVEPVIVRDINDKITLLHSSATFKNAFEYKVDIDPKYVESIKINNQSYAPIADTKEGGFIVRLTDDVIREIGAFTCTPKDYHIEIIFSREKIAQDQGYKYSGLTQESFDEFSAPYNPYIWSVSGCEIHLPNYRPTGFADWSFFGTKDDRSDRVNRFYVGPESEPYPFAIHIDCTQRPDYTFTIPTERKPISDTYPKYLDWVQLGCKDGDENHANWFLFPN